uniref:BTB domain-containing protein n=1 Tax=Rhabditophanes sp. KR3021 TaxID=114890 RepID=A0AC35UCJ0_9BILA
MFVLQSANPSAGTVPAVEEDVQEGLGSFSNNLVSPNGLISFEHTWTTKIFKRKITPTESMILNCSTPFSASYNGVHFSWGLKLLEEVDFCGDNADYVFQRSFPGAKHDKKYNIFLYYKDGPTRDISLHSASIYIANGRYETKFENIPITQTEYIKGSGWCAEFGPEQKAFSKFMNRNMNRHINITVKMEMNGSSFQPLTYLPILDYHNKKLEEICTEAIENVFDDTKLPSTDDESRLSIDSLTLHKSFFREGREETERIWDEVFPRQNLDYNLINNALAHTYFKTKVLPNLACFEDYTDLLENCIYIRFVSIIRECERYMCNDAMMFSCDNDVIIRLLVLSQRFDLPILKMVCLGIYVDTILEGNKTIDKDGDATEKLKGIKDDIKQIANQINFISEDEESSGEEDDSETIAGAVISQLQTLSLRVQKVSMSPKIVSDPNTPCTSPIPLAFAYPHSRRSSLKNSRDKRGSLTSMTGFPPNSLRSPVNSVSSEPASDNLDASGHDLLSSSFTPITTTPFRTRSVTYNHSFRRVSFANNISSEECSPLLSKLPNVSEHGSSQSPSFS